MLRSNDRADPSQQPPPLTSDDALFIDFDGTLIELGPTPDAVTVPAELGPLLLALSGRLGGAVAVVSGRPLADLASRLALFAGAIAGQHGGEIRRPSGRISRVSAEGASTECRDMLAHFAAHHLGVMFEDKGSAIALHYRGAPGLADACRAIAREAETASNGRLRAIDGNRVIELVPRHTGKDTAIATLAAEPPFHARVPVFVGDDATDEDGFAIVDRLGGISIKVGPGATAARYRLANVAAVWDWLVGSGDR